ncbi:hypothetical protein [Nocardia otitidiscaviarum]|uniref:hypothetical protein n=1 Tax=Nocardia otitidiscaviarum TaxID=1823 RepID=UPI0004A6AC9B|nr:hypothetical protein [Nocardia otitidiscaviarum]
MAEDMDLLGLARIAWERENESAQAPAGAGYLWDEVDHTVRQALTDGMRAVLCELERRGWRPPARVVETREEMDSLPIGSMVIEAGYDEWQSDPEPRAWVRTAFPSPSMHWAPVGEDGGQYLTSEINVPVVVVWEPKEASHG